MRQFISTSEYLALCLLDAVLGSIAWLIVRIVLPINTSAGDSPLSLGWMLVLYVMRNRLIDPSVPPSPFVLSKARFNGFTNFSA